jgi:hypothetical protein
LVTLSEKGNTVSAPPTAVLYPVILPVFSSITGVKPCKLSFNSENKIIKINFKERKYQMKDKLILSNNTKIEIESGSSLSGMKIISETKYDMLTAWDMLTEENLKHIEIQNEDGVAIGSYDNILLEREASTIQPDGKILTSFHLREKTEVELLRERIEQLESGQEVQDGAISDLGAAVSGLAEEGGLA